MVSEQVMTADAKSKAAANLLRFRFINVFFGSQVQYLHLRRSVFGSRTNVFLLGKAETAVQTRQVFVDALRRAVADIIFSAIDERLRKHADCAIRYMDDYEIIGETEGEALHVLAELQNDLLKFGLLLFSGCYFANKDAFR